MDPSRTPPTVELLRVDLGGKPDHIARKCAANIQLRLARNGFLPFVQTGGFRLVVITGTTEKAAALRAALDQHLWPEGLSIHLAIAPDLPLLTARLSHGW